MCHILENFGQRSIKQSHLSFHLTKRHNLSIYSGTFITLQSPVTVIVCVVVCLSSVTVEKINILCTLDS